MPSVRPDRPEDDRLVSEILKIAPAEARTIQKGLFHKYGTTLRGLMVEHEVDPIYFLRHAHDIDYAPFPNVAG
jgi:putative hydrolase of the HAD superfamily